MEKMLSQVKHIALKLFAKVIAIPSVLKRTWRCSVHLFHQVVGQEQVVGDVDSEHNIIHQQSQVETSDPSTTITINLPSAQQVQQHQVQQHHVHEVQQHQQLHDVNTLNVQNTVSETAVLSADYMNILDAVLDKSNMQEVANLSSAPTIVLADMNDTGAGTVSYTHLTLPTIYSV